MLLKLYTKFSSSLLHINKMIYIYIFNFLSQYWNVDIDAKLLIFYILFRQAFFKCKVIVSRGGVHFEM